MNSNLKTVLLILLIIYVISPADLMVGPIDDILLIIAYNIVTKNSYNDYIDY